MAWAEDFAPQTLKEVAGNPSAVEDIESWAKRPKGALLLAGPPGSGKTAAAIALAADMDWELFELNASDLRSKKVLEKVAGLASVSATFSGKKRMILFDEIDGLFRVDYGGAGAVLNIIRNSACPIVLTANDEYAKNISSIRKESKVVKFKKVHYATIKHVLEKICKEKKVSCDAKALETIAKANHGDLKAAINDLQALAVGKRALHEDDVLLSDRDREGSIFSAMLTVFKTTHYEKAKAAFDSVQEDPDLFMKWVDENIPREYKEPEDLANAFNALSRADFYAAGIYRRQNWSLMKFQIAMMTAGVAMAKKEKYHGFTSYQFPTFIRKLFATKGKRAARKSAAKKIGHEIHASPHEVLTDHWPYLRLLAKKNPAGYAETFGLDEKELQSLGVTEAAARKAVK
ncbi:MAG: replication factor C large subunit [Candidatus Diapherotrites archaeon]|nr:replication factor C large subunit [Candidatus Diapherotrites archaeon]